MAEILNFKPALARQRVRRAERSVNRANELLDEDCGVGLSLALCGGIRSAQSRVIDARTRFLKIRPAAHY